MKKNNKNSKNAGFTLLEVILSIAILAVISIPLMKYFSDSLKHTSFAGRKQKATLAAQETLEFIKAQDRLMVQSSTAPVDPSASPSFTWELAPALQTKFEVGESDAGSILTGYVPSDGKGLMMYKYVDDSDPDLAGFDILVTLYTDVSANDVTKPINYGINDTSNIVASESIEQTQALAYFVNRNIMAHNGVVDPYVDPYVSASPDPTYGPVPTFDPFGGGDGSETPTPAPTSEPSASPAASGAPVTVPLLSEAEIADLMERDIYVEIDRPAGTYYTVKVYYLYKCTDIVGPSEDTVPYTLYDDAIDELEGIYLMFNQIKTNDVIKVKWLAATAPEKPIVLRMVCQNLSEPGGLATLYNPTLELTGFSAGNYPEIKTNILDDDGDANISCSEIAVTDMSNLVEGDSSVRTFDVTVSVYKKGALNADLSTTQDPLAEMVTTKVE